ncbi:CG17486 [Drosophila busckii]|uniref:Asparagine synthetase [glutamine-hydrolyzing] n=1 Tax=Drosophila busckii TaxID=30019 RepID=A0A0M4EI64_DROBS|nr:asparagine synthetase domain-containing protein CG17486 [Drosophila busckii]ALC48504.1 CG17486 [Drosophila busckii]
MCGIFCAIGAATEEVSCHLHSALQTLLQNRGPDVQQQLLIDNVLLAGHVLWQQGAAAQPQPIAEQQLVLLFNGDLYNLNESKPKEQADSAWLLQQLLLCADDEAMLALLRGLEGPYCLILYNRQEQLLYFCRDALGRNSLIIERQQQTLKLMSSSYFVAGQQSKVLELPPLGLYKLSLKELHKCSLYPWQQLLETQQTQLQLLNEAMQWCMQLEQPIAPSWLQQIEQTKHDYDFYELCGGGLQLEQLLLEPAVAATLAKLHKLLLASVRERVLQTAPVCRHCQQQRHCEHAKLSILYSGGIDCSILALLAHRFVPAAQPIELINVAFERVGDVAQQSWQVPDRLSAQQTLQELHRICPERCWQLLEVNVSREELQQQLKQHICQLIYPLQTVLDESLGAAFWFAAAAPQSHARVALLGSGADELFGGYVRHRKAWRRGGAEQLLAELEHDWQRIPARNLARDDRVIADCGKTARAPFIEEHLVHFVRSLAPAQRCCFTLPEGVGDKLLLRLYGYSLGLRDAVQLKKRAIQFGSRIADKKQQANEISTYLKIT